MLTFLLPFIFKWCYQENGAIYSSETEKLQSMMDTIALLIIACFQWLM